MSIQLPPNLVWTILVAKFFCIFYMALNAIRTGKKYRERKNTVTLWLTITFLTYLIATIITTINTIIWYIDYELYKENWTSTFNGIFMVLAATALLKFTFEVFYETTEQQTKNRAQIIVIVQFIVVLVTSIIGIVWASVNGISNNPFGTAIIVLAAITYIYLIIQTTVLIQKIKKSAEEQENINRISSIKFGALFTLISVIIVILDYFLQDVDSTGYTFFAPIGYWVLALGMAFLYKAFK